MNEQDGTICAGTNPNCLHTKRVIDRWSWHRLPDGRSLCPVCWGPALLPLSQLIGRLGRLDGTERVTVPAHQREQLLALLRELRARRIAMGRQPDDEVNAPADMCCCKPDPPNPAQAPLTYAKAHLRRLFDDGCPLHPRPAPGTPLRDVADGWPAGTRRSRNTAVIAFARETWPNDGAEGETVHFLCDELERIMGPRPTGYDGSTGAEFLEAATEALGGGLELHDGMGFCVGCGERDCCCPAVTVAGPLLRCGCFRTTDCPLGTTDCSGCREGVL